MLKLNIILNGENAWPDLAERRDAIVYLNGANARMDVAALPGGMTSGKASVALRLDLPDGRVVIAETSLALWLSAADALRARYGGADGDQPPVAAWVEEAATYTDEQWNALLRRAQAQRDQAQRDQAKGQGKKGDTIQ